MTRAMFHLGLPVLEKVLRAAIIYGFLVVALRVTGKRELAQLSPLDFIVLLAVANAVQNGIIGKDDSVTGGIIGAITLFTLNWTISYVTYKSKATRHTILGSPTALIRDGVVLEDQLAKEHMTHEDLIVAVERANASHIDDVKDCVLLPSGNFLVDLKPERQNQLLSAINQKLDLLVAKN